MLFAEAEGALAAADNRIALLEESARKDQHQMETLSKQLGELTAIRSMLEVEVTASKKEMKSLRDEIDRLTKLLNEATTARDAAVRQGLELQSQIDRALLEKTALQAALSGTNTSTIGARDRNQQHTHGHIRPNTRPLSPENNCRINYYYSFNLVVTLVLKVISNIL